MSRAVSLFSINSVAVIALCGFALTPQDTRIDDNVKIESRSEFVLPTAEVFHSSPMIGSATDTVRPIKAVATSTDLPVPSVKTDFEESKPAAAADDAVPGSETLLRDAQRLTIKFGNFQKLSGDYLISADYTISVPALGVIYVGSLTSSELKRKLSQLVMQRVGREGEVSVEVAEYRPIFVTGLVRNSGSYPWRPGMIVLHAETLSGGLTALGGAAPGMQNPLAIDNEETRQLKAESDLKRVLVLLARLAAEQKDSPIIDVPARLVELAGPAESKQLIEAQTTVLRTSRASRAAQLTGLEQGAKLVREELANLRAQLVNLKESTEARRKVYREVQKLYERKLVQTERLLNEQARVADLEEKQANVRVGIVRSEGVLLNFQRDIDNFKSNRLAEINSETFKLEREAAQLEIDIKASTSNQRKLTQSEPERALDGQQKLRYQIFRSSEAGSSILPATRFTEVRPGDVVVITVDDEKDERIAQGLSSGRGAKSEGSTLGTDRSVGGF